jgi:hypothetical protein
MTVEVFVMLTIDELIRNVHDYVSGRMSLEHFDQWFESIADVYDNPALRQVYESIEGALSEYYFDHVGQGVLKSALANAIRPFERPSPNVVLVEKYRLIPKRSVAASENLRGWGMPSEGCGTSTNVLRSPALAR